MGRGSTNEHGREQRGVLELCVFLAKGTKLPCTSIWGSMAAGWGRRGHRRKSSYWQRLLQGNSIEEASVAGAQGEGAAGAWGAGHAENGRRHHGKSGAAKESRGIADSRRPGGVTGAGEEQGRGANLVSIHGEETPARWWRRALRLGAYAESCASSGGMEQRMEMAARELLRAGEERQRSTTGFGKERSICWLI